MMTETKREISGFFLSSEKFAAHIAALASPDCTTSHVRLFHNEPHHSAALLDALSRSPSVTSLDIFELDPAAAATLASLLTATPRLTALAVHRPHGQDAVAALARGLAANHTLTHLHLSQLDPRGVAAVAEALSAWAAAPPPPPPPGTDEDLTDPGDSHAEGDCQMLSDPTTARSQCQARLQQLRLDKCAFTPEAAAALAAALGSQAAALVRLELVECELGDAAAAALLAAPGAGALAAGGALASLDLSACQIGKQGAALLGRFLARCTSLAALNLANNRTLGCAGAAALQPSIAASTSLRRLDLSNCGLGAGGVAALAAALRGDPGMAAAAAATMTSQPPSQPPLQQLSLSDNVGGAAGLLALLNSMSGARPCALQTLNLDRNHVRGVEVAQALGLPTALPSPLRFAAAAAAAAPPPQPPPPAAAAVPLVTAPLETLSLAGNALWDAGAAALAATLAAAPCLEYLDVRENGISDSGMAALLPLLAPPPAAAGGEQCARPGLSGLMLDGNRLHNAGGQALLEAVSAAPGLWRFSAEGNKVTDPALRISLAELGQQRAARHSQLVVLGRHFSSSSSSSSASDDGAGPGRRRGSGDGEGGGGADSGTGRRGRSSGGGETHPTAAPMDVDGDSGGGGHGEGAANNGNTQCSIQIQSQQMMQKLRVHGRSEGGCCSGDEQPPTRNVAARGPGSPPAPAPYGGGGGGGCGGGGGGASMAVDIACDGRAGCYGGAWRSNGGVPYGTAYPRRGSSSGGGASDTSTQSCTSGGGSGGYGLAGSPPSPPSSMALAGVGGAASVGVSRRVGAAGGGWQPQHVLPSTRCPRYKPLTPEQQRMFEDF